MHWMSKQHQVILELIKRNGTLSIDDLVAELNLSKNATRSHLLNLEKLGLLERVESAKPQRGRPKLSYRISAKGQVLFPTSDREILTSLLQFLIDKGQTDLVEAFFREMWERRHLDYQQELLAQKGESTDLQTRLQALQAVLEKGHFMPEVQAETQSTESSEDTTDPKTFQVTIKECNCPFPAAVRATRVPCRLEGDFLAQVIGTSPDSIQYSSKEQGYCLYQFSIQPKEK